MNAIFDFQDKSSLPRILVITLLLLAACSTDSYPQRPTGLPTEASPATPMSLPTQYPVAATNTPANTPALSLATPPVATTVTPTPPEIGLKIIPIETERSRCVEWASWYDNGKLVYYAFIPSCDSDGDKSLEWAAYDLEFRDVPR